MRVDESGILPDSLIAELFARYGGDSLDRVEFVMAVEEEYSDLEVSDEEAGQWEDGTHAGTVQQLAEFIDRHRRPPT
jgi:acyl carrier protein